MGDTIHVSSLSLKQVDPSAGSPTETLLRLLLPLNAKIRIERLLFLSCHSIGSSDGRCVQRAGT